MPFLQYRFGVQDRGRRPYRHTSRVHYQQGIIPFSSCNDSLSQVNWAAAVSAGVTSVLVTTTF
jgi:hypothetical protein